MFSLRGFQFLADLAKLCKLRHSIVDLGPRIVFAEGEAYRATL
jgi:hypothetical protein